MKSLFSKRDPRVSLNLETQYANQYAASGPNTLIDGVRGGADFRTGDWQGYFGKDLNAVVSFEEERELTLMLMIDVSGSELFGTQGQFKREELTEIAATLSFSAKIAIAASGWFSFAMINSDRRVKTLEDQPKITT